MTLHRWAINLWMNKMGVGSKMFRDVTPVRKVKDGRMLKIYSRVSYFVPIPMEMVPAARRGVRPGWTLYHRWGCP